MKGVDEKTVVIIGGGIMGVCTAWYLSKQNFKHIILLESHTIPREVGSASVDGNRAIRYSYGDGAGYTVMVHDAYNAWDELFADVSEGETLLVNTGSLLIKSKTSEKNLSDYNTADVKNSWIEDSIATMTKYKDKINFTGHYLTNEELVKLHPFIQAENILFSYYTPSGGILFAGDIVAKTAKWLKVQPNVTVYEGEDYEVTKLNIPNQTEVTEYSQNNDTNTYQNSTCVSCTTQSGLTFEADHMIVAAGIYINKLKSSAEDSIFYTRHVVTYMKDENVNIMESWKKMPLIMEVNDTNSFYFLPNIGGNGTYGIKAADRKYNKIHYEKDSIQNNGSLSNFDESTMNWMKQRFTKVSHENLKIAHSKACYHDYSKENGNFIIDSLNNDSTSIALYGFSGHGFKFGALTGKIVFDTIMGNKKVNDIKDWFAGKMDCLYNEF